MHPDKNSAPGASEACKRLSAAWEAVNNAETTDDSEAGCCANCGWFQRDDVFCGGCGQHWDSCHRVQAFGEGPTKRSQGAAAINGDVPKKVRSRSPAYMRESTCLRWRRHAAVRKRAWTCDKHPCRGLALLGGCHCHWHASDEEKSVARRLRDEHKAKAKAK